YVALSFLERHPERVAGLGLLDTQMGPDTAEKRQQRAETVQAVQESGTQALSVDALFSPSTQQRNPLAISSAQQYAREADPAGVIWALEAMAARPERTYVVREADVPVLILAGEDDAMTPLSVLSDPLEEIEDIAAVTVPNAGHLSAMEDPQAVAEALDKLVERAREAVGSGRLCIRSALHHARYTRPPTPRPLHAARNPPPANQSRASLPRERAPPVRKCSAFEPARSARTPTPGPLHDAPNTTRANWS